MRALKEVFGAEKPIIGMLHMAGLSADEKMAIARREIGIMYRNGVNAVLVENYYGGAEDVINALKYLQENYPDKVYGVNMLGNPEWAFILARQYGAKFVQMDSVCGHLRPNKEEAFLKKLETMRGENDIFLLGGVRFKYQPVLSKRTLEEDLILAKDRCDAIVVTGEGTGISTDLGKIKTFRSILGDFPLIVGAGMTAESAKEQLAIADGAIVGSYFKKYGEAEYPVDEQRVDTFMSAVAQHYPSTENTIFSYEKIFYGKGYPAKLFGPFIKHANARGGGVEDRIKLDFVYPTGAVITKYTGEGETAVVPSFIDGLRVVGIGESAFDSQKQLKEVWIEEGILRIGVDAFSECTSLHTVHLPQSLEMIDGGAFGYTGISELSLPRRLRKIGQVAFEATPIKELVLPQKLEVLGHSAFEDCKSLEKVYIPSDIQYFVDVEVEDGEPYDLHLKWLGLMEQEETWLDRVWTFRDCTSLVEVNTEREFSEREKLWIFDNTPWLKAQETE